MEPILKRADVLAEAKTSTFLTLWIVAAAGIWNARAGASTVADTQFFIKPVIYKGRQTKDEPRIVIRSSTGT